MPDKKNSLILYTDYLEQIEMLNNEQRGILLTALLALQNEDELPEMDSLTKLAFSFISADVRRNNEKYKAICEKRRVAGRKGGKKSKQTQANQANANDNDNDNDSDNDNDNDTVFDQGPSDEVPPAQTHTVPSLDEVKAYCIERKNGIDASKFFEYYQMREWKLANGGQMKDWKAAVRYWETREKKEARAKPTKFSNYQERSGTDWDALELAAIKKSMEEPVTELM